MFKGSRDRIRLVGIYYLLLLILNMLPIGEMRDSEVTLDLFVKIFLYNVKGKLR